MTILEKHELHLSDYQILKGKVESFRKYLEWAANHPNRWNNSAPSRQAIFEKFKETFAEEQTKKEVKN